MLKKRQSNPVLKLRSNNPTKPSVDSGDSSSMAIARAFASALMSEKTRPVENPQTSVSQPQELQQQPIPQPQPQPQQSMASKVISDATATGNYVGASDMASLAPSQLNNGNGRSFFIEIGADLTADLPPIAGDPIAGGGLQTGSQFQQKALAPSYTISTARIKEQVGCLDRSKYYMSWKIALDTAYVQRDTTLAPDATTYPSNPNRSSLATKPEPVYLCSEQLQNACGNSRYFTRFGQAEITEGLYTTAFARFDRDLPSNITFQFPCCLDLIPDNAEKYYANSPRIFGTRDLSSGRPMAAPYYENQFVKRFNIRFIVTVDIGLNSLPVYGRVLSTETGSHVLGNTPGINFQGAGETAGGSSSGRAQVESAQAGYDVIASKQADALRVAQGHIDELRKISENQAVQDFAKIGGKGGSKILEAINSLAGAATSAINQATMITALTGTGNGMLAGPYGRRLGGNAVTSNIPANVTIAPLPEAEGSVLASSSTLLGTLPSDLTSTLSESTAELPSLRNLNLAQLPKYSGDEIGNSFMDSSRTDISREDPSFLSGEEPPALRGGERRIIAPTLPLRGTFTGTSITAPTLARGEGIGGLGGLAFEELPARPGPLSTAINPFSGTGFRTEGISRVQASRDLMQGKSFYEYVERGADFPPVGIARPSAVRVQFAESLRANILRRMPGGAAGGPRTIDPNNLAEAIADYSRRSGGFTPNRANIAFLVESISDNYFRLI